VQLIHLVDVVDYLINFFMFYFHRYIHDDDVMFCGPILFVTGDNNNSIGFYLNYKFSFLGRIPHLSTHCVTNAPLSLANL